MKRIITLLFLPCLTDYSFSSEAVTYRGFLECGKELKLRLVDFGTKFRKGNGFWFYGSQEEVAKLAD